MAAKRSAALVRARKAFEAFRGELEALPATERAAVLGQVEIVLDAVRETTDAELKEDAGVRAAHAVRRWARIAGAVVSPAPTARTRVDARTRASTKVALERIGAIVAGKPADQSAQIAVARVVAWHVEREGTSRDLAASLSHVLGAEVSGRAASRLLAAWKRRRGERANGAPTKHAAMFELLGPLGFAQSASAIAQALKPSRSGK